MSTATKPRVQARWEAEESAGMAFLRAQKPAKPATTLEGIQARIARASRRAEALRRDLLADGSNNLPNRETLLKDLRRVENDLEIYWADKRRVLAADEMGGYWW